ncbi:MAG: translocation/assembly module TamB, partial [Holosporaceae bacterium]|nr:translocation/assembly module TamB [Holosporaceae bacterium]
QISAEKLELISQKGFLKSSEPFIIGNNADYSFEFNFNQLDFWKKIVPISGQGSGIFSRKKGIFSGQLDLPRLALKNCEFHSLKLRGNENNLQITAKNADIWGIKLGRTELKISDERFNLSGKVNDDGKLKAYGKIGNFFQKISPEYCEIIFSRDKTRFDINVLNAKPDDYEVRCILSDKKKFGEAKINFHPEKTICAFKTFPIEKFMKLFNYSAPDCRLDGTVQLKRENENFTGDGTLSLSNLLAHKQELAINFTLSHGGVKIETNFKNNKNFMEISAFLPINLKSNGFVFENPHGDSLDCHIKANACLEQSLELPDNSDLRGNLNCDLHMAGSFSNPIVSGKAQLQKMYLGIGDILLRNGTIFLIGNGKNIDVLRAEFIDHKGKKATISGNGKLFFDGIIPNIDTNLQLKFDNFTLFDSDNLKIKVKGNGSMTGPINDMTIRGNIIVPRCELLDFASDDTSKELDIKIENDTYFNNDKKEEKKNDFFKYDVSLHCENIKFFGNIFEMYFLGDLQLSTYNNERTLVGELKLYKGKLDLFGKRMRFSKGKVIFLKEFPFDPKASFVCKRNFRDMNVELDIKSAPKKGVSFNLHSTPNYKQDVILSKMLFEKESTYLTVGEAAQLAHAIASLKQGRYILSILNTFQNLGVVDSISFTSSEKESSSLYSNSQNTSTQNNVNISAGKYINDNVYISINKKSEGATFDMDFSITPRISIKANTNGEAGISWKYRY